MATRRDGAPLSLWHDQGPAPKQREPLVGGDEADVVIVGGGYTGLWTAYYLLEADADLRVVVIEAEFCGYGASGRNGGWASARFPGNRSAMADAHGMAAVVEYQRHMFDAVDEIGRIADKEGIDCDFRKGGVLLYATTPAHVPRLHGYMQDLWHWGCEAGDLEWLDISEARRRAAVAGTRGAMFNRHCASINPWRLVAGLAEAVERRGAVIYEKSRARVIRPNMVVTDDGVVRAKTVLRCTEAFTAELPGHSRTVAPVYSLMLATEPLPPEWWETVGLHNGETFSDERHLIIYGQRTADGRFAFGGRGAPYHFGSTVRDDWDVDPRTHELVRRVLWSLFPQLSEARVTHRWGGAVAVPRDWRTSVDFDPGTGLGHAGGYVGQGVASANLAGRTLADLVLGERSPRTRLPYVGHRWRKWEPEPLRWLGINLGRTLAPLADAIERRSRRPSRLVGGALNKLTGG